MWTFWGGGSFFRKIFTNYYWNLKIFTVGILGTWPDLQKKNSVDLLYRSIFNDSEKLKNTGFWPKLHKIWATFCAKCPKKIFFHWSLPKFFQVISMVPKNSQKNFQLIWIISCWKNFVAFCDLICSSRQFLFKMRSK